MPTTTTTTTKIQENSGKKSKIFEKSQNFRKFPRGPWEVHGVPWEAHGKIFENFWIFRKFWIIFSKFSWIFVVVVVVVVVVLEYHKPKTALKR